MNPKHQKVPFWAKLLFGFMAKLPVSWLNKLGAVIGYIFYIIDKNHRGITLRNLARVFPEKPKKERKQIAKAAFRQVGRTLLEIPFVFLGKKEKLLNHVSVEGEDILKAALAENKGVFLMAAHYSNWELMGLLPSMLGYDVSNIYRPLNQKSLDAFTLVSRTRFGTNLYPRNTGLRWLLTALKKNHCIIVALDQHMGAGNGIRVPFLGHIASTTGLPAPFVNKNQTPMVGMALERQNNGFDFKLKFWRIETPEVSGDKARDEIAVMTEACRSFDDVIKPHPEQWLWMHRRWRAVETDENMTNVVHGAP
ncbi:MAG: lysophospholipid acyltransferase family protein [Ghiorsea sp.]